MRCEVYLFDDVVAERGRDYYVQRVKNRRLTSTPHSHDFYEVIYFQRGGGEKMVNGRPVSVCEGSLMILRPGDSHYFLSQTDSVRIISASVRPAEFRRICGVFDEGLSGRIDTESAPPMVKGITSLSAVSREDHHRTDEREEKLWLCEALKAYLDACDEVDGDGLTAALARMREEKNLRLGIAALERESGYSRSHLNRLLRERYGTSPKRYINGLRLERSRELLISTDLSVSEIAEAVGFLSESHFSKVFLERFALTPAQLRRTVTV